MFPRAKLLIRDTTDPEIVYDNVHLMDKSSLAIAEAINPNTKDLEVQMELLRMELVSIRTKISASMD